MNFQKKDINFLIIESNQSDLEAIKKQLKAAFPESLFFIAHSMVEANEFLDGTILLNIILIDASIFDGDKNLLEYACSNSDLPIILLCDFDKEEFCNGLLSDKILDYIVKENSSKNLLSKTYKTASADIN